MSTTNHGYVAQPYRNPASRLETLLPGQPHPIQDEGIFHVSYNRSDLPLAIRSTPVVYPSVIRIDVRSYPILVGLPPRQRQVRTKTLWS